MNLDELQSVQSRERQTDSLQQLRASFYEDAAGFVQDLRERREEAASRADDPFDSPDVNRLSDDIRTAEQTVEAIYERRVGKVVKMASLAAADMPTEQEGLTKEEQELFETMVQAIEDHRERILAVLDGEAPTGVVSAQPDQRRGSEAAAATAPGDEDRLDAAAVMGEDDEDAAGPGADDAGDQAPDPGAFDPPADAAAEGETEVDPDDDAGAGATGESDGDGDDGTGDDEATGKPPGDSSATERTTVRITEDVGEIFGVDEREYDLAADDVVTLPTTNAEPLIDRDAAERLE